ncbi:response regulator [Thermodesulfobacteriota bacterium]
MLDIHEMTVLIADDAVPMCKSIHKMMKVIGYGGDFFFAHNGREALDILAVESIDLVLLDYNMPVMTGGVALSLIREDQKLKELPVIMVTAEAYRDYVAEVGESEIDAYILKPVTIRLLEEKVGRVVQKVNNPPPMIYHLKRARNFADEGNLDAAIQETELAMATNPKATRPIRELGYYYFKKNNIEKAEEWLLKAAKMNYLDVFAFHHLGELYLKKNDIDKAAEFFEKAMKISPRHLERGINFGKTLVRKKMVKRAIEVFDKVFDLTSGTTELQEEIADFCIHEEIYDYAARLLETIVMEKPHRGDLCFKLAKTLEHIGEVKKAVTYLVNAADIEEKNEDVRIHLAKDYLILKKPLLAEKPIKEVLNLNPEHKEARDLLRHCA